MTVPTDFWWVAVWDPLALDDPAADLLERFVHDRAAPWTHLIVRDRTRRSDRGRLTRVLSAVPADRLWINRDLDLAVELGAAGLTLGSTDEALANAARARGLRWICAVHGLDDLQLATARDATALLYGHIRDTPSKPGVSGRGFDALREICAQSRLPVMAIGGLTPADAARVAATGASGLAALRAPFSEAPRGYC